MTGAYSISKAQANLQLDDNLTAASCEPHYDPAKQCTGKQHCSMETEGLTLVSTYFKAPVARCYPRRAV
jgi:hypothetical protein